MVVATDQTTRLERDRARAEALGFVTHELRTPLVSIQGFAEYLLRYSKERAGIEAAATIFQESGRLVAIINTYLDVLRLEAGARPMRNEDFQIGEIVRQVARVIQPIAQASEIRVRAEIADALPTIQGDSHLIEGALLNLMSNAIKYSAGGREVKLCAKAEGAAVVLEVWNPGPAIPEEELTRLFEPFYRRSEQAEKVRGWGLGLAFVKTGGAIPFELGTPSAVITVRGTQFDVEVNSRSVTEVDVVDGLVEVYGRNGTRGSVLLEPGFSTRVGMGLDPEQPEPTDQIRPEVERPEPGENETSGKSELEVEFERAEVERETKARESADSVETREIQEISVAVEGEAKPGSEPQ